MNIKQIKDLYKKYAVPAHVKKHMMQVAKVAVAIGKRINSNKGKKIVNLKILNYAALLHDLIKVCDFSPNDRIFFNNKYSEHQKETWRRLIKKYAHKKHIHAAAEILRTINEDEIAGLVEKHDYKSVVAKNTSDRPNTPEEKIIYYADKRVLHDSVVDLKTRFSDGQKRYAHEKTPLRLRKTIEKKTYQIEKELCRRAGIAPDDLEKLII